VVAGASAAKAKPVTRRRASREERIGVFS